MNRRNFVKIVAGGIAIGTMPVLWAGEKAGKSNFDGGFVQWVSEFQYQLEDSSYEYPITKFKYIIMEYLDYVKEDEDKMIDDYSVWVEENDIFVSVSKNSNSQWGDINSKITFSELMQNTQVHIQGVRFPVQSGLVYL